MSKRPSKPKPQTTPAPKFYAVSPDEIATAPLRLKVPARPDARQLADMARLGALTKKERRSKGRLPLAELRELALLRIRFECFAVICHVRLSADGQPVVVVREPYSVAVESDRQLAEIFGVSCRTIERWKQEPDFPRPMLGGPDQEPGP